MSDFSSVPLLDIQQHVATITLNRPAHRNRLHSEDLETLLAHCKTIDAATDVRVVVLTSNTHDQPRPVFCAGFHVGEFDGVAPVVPFELVPDAIEALKPVTICAMPGSVYGGATDVALACDFRIGIEGMELRMPAAALGLHYYPSGLARYVSRLGLQAAKRAFLMASVWSDHELLQAGYLDELVPCTELPWVIGQMTQKVCALAPLAVAGMKRSLNELACTGATAENLKSIRVREVACAASHDFIEGRRAFAQKRTPVFGGK